MQHRLVGRAAELRRLRHAMGRGGLRGAMVSGPAGVGKTRLAREWLRATARHRPSLCVSGTNATAVIPFGAFASLLPDELPTDTTPLQVLQAARHALFERDPGRRGLAVLIDDAHLLDDGSAALVHQLVEADDAFVVLTLRNDEPAPAPVVAVGQDDRVEWVELDPLTRDEVEVLAAQMLAGPVEEATLRQLWDRAGGNPLFVTELVRGGRETGALTLDDGRWQATRPLTVSGRLRQVLDARIHQLPDDHRRALELLVHAERFELRLLEQVAGVDALTALEQRGLVTVEQDRRRELVAVAHPLYAEVARGRTPHMASRQIAGELASRLEQAGMRRRDDLLRWADWRLTAGQPAPPDRLLTAARAAKVVLDPVLAERCADAAVSEGGGFTARLLHAEAVAAQGRTEEAHIQFTRLAAEATDDAERAQVALARGTSLLFHAGDRRSLDVVEAAIDTVTASEWRDELQAMLVFAAAYLGDLPRAVEEGGRLLARLDAAVPAAARTAVIHTYVQVLLGRYASAADRIEQGLTAARRHPEAFPIAEHLLLANQTVGLETSGRIREAEQLARTHHQDAVTADTLELRGLWATNLGFALSLRGDLTGFVRHLDEALAALRQRDPVGMLRVAISWAAQAHAMVGHRRQARRLLAEHDAYVQGRTPAFGTTPRPRADAWLHPGGLGADAAALALHAAEIAREEHHVAFGSLSAHDAVRFGHPELVLTTLEDFASHAEGELTPAFADHARLLHARDTAGLEELSYRFEDLGADLYAAEAAAQASHLHTRSGADAAARTARTRALALAGSGTRCPTLWLWIDRPGQLTDRQLEIAQLAASGLSDRDIAERLTLSPRTVGNHLASVYSKLDVTGRAELSPLLQPTEPSADT